MVQLVPSWNAYCHKAGSSTFPHRYCSWSRLSHNVWIREEKGWVGWVGCQLYLGYQKRLQQEKTKQKKKESRGTWNRLSKSQHNLPVWILQRIQIKGMSRLWGKAGKKWNSKKKEKTTKTIKVSITIFQNNKQVSVFFLIVVTRAALGVCLSPLTGPFHTQGFVWTSFVLAWVPWTNKAASISVRLSARVVANRAMVDVFPIYLYPSLSFEL